MVRNIRHFFQRGLEFQILAIIAAPALRQKDGVGRDHQKREAGEAGMTLPQFLEARYGGGDPKNGTVFAQILASEGIFVQPDRSIGIRSSTMAEILNGVQAGTNVADQTPASRILFPAVVMASVESKLNADRSMTANAFDELIALDSSITSQRYEHPVINYSRPEAARSSGVAQLAMPTVMMTITVSDKSYRIPGTAIGIQVSDQALQATSLDLVTLAVTRQAEVERNERAQGYMLAILNGDVDNGESSMADLGKVKPSSFFDSAATGGVMTHRAWMKFLMYNGTQHTLSHIVTDFDTAMKIENRVGKPTANLDDSKTSRIDTQFTLMNPTWARNPSIFLTQDPNWPAGTIMGLDRRYALRRVRSLSLSYQAIESYVMRRATQMRIDSGEHVNRLFVDSFEVMSLA